MAPKESMHGLSETKLKDFMQDLLALKLKKVFAPDKLYFDTQTSYHLRNLVVYINSFLAKC